MPDYNTKSGRDTSFTDNYSVPVQAKDTSCMKAVKLYFNSLMSLFQSALYTIRMVRRMFDLISGFKLGDRNEKKWIK